MQQWPKYEVEERLPQRKNMWMKQNIKWLTKWDINMLERPNTDEEIKRSMLE